MGKSCHLLDANGQSRISEVHLLKSSGRGGHVRGRDAGASTDVLQPKQGAVAAVAAG
jgi:hypothetical protein